MNPELSPFIPWQHGGLTPTGGMPDPSVLDLSVNINPYGPDSDLCTYLQRQAYDQYPDPQQTEVRRQLGRLHQTTMDNLLIGNGANELFWAAARAFLKPGDRWIAVEPNYSEFARAAESSGAKKIILQARPEQNFHWTIAELSHLIERHSPRWIMLSNPCSPTGFLQDPRALLALAQAFPATLFGLDHSFLSLSRHWNAADFLWPDNVLRFQSLTKDFSIAGLRLGYIRGHSSLLPAMQRHIPTWSVNSLAQAAGIWIARHHDRLHTSRQQLLADHDALENGLEKRSIPFVPSQTIFTMLRPPQAPSLAKKLWDRHRILVRSCASYGLPEWWRVAARPQSVMQHFWKALDEEIPCPN